MAKYGQAYYGQVYYGATPLDDRVVFNVVTRRGIEGPQTILTWTKPIDYPNVTKLRIIRKMGSFPEDETDGKNIFETADISIENFTDFPNFAPEFFYYKIFTEYLSSWASNALSQGVELAADTQSEKQDKFFRELAEINQTFDKARYGSRQEILSPADLDSFEKMMLAEDGVAQQGQLQRFLKIFNSLFNEPLSLVRALATRDGMQVIHNINRTSPDHLDQIAKLYGWRYNWDLPVIAARAEVKGLPDLYKKKGRKDQTEQLINDILFGHTATIIPMDEVIDMNGYPNGFLNTLSLIDEINFLTSLNSVYIIADLTSGTSSIGFNQVAINIIPGTTEKLRTSQIRKLESLTDDFFNILDDVYIIVHETFNIDYSTDFTTAGQTFISSYFPLPNPTLLQAFGHFAIGAGLDIWDFIGTPPTSPSDSKLKNEKFRDLPRNLVFLDGSDNPTLTPTKKVLLRCFMDLGTFSSIDSREVGQFGNDSTSGKDSGTLLFNKNTLIRFISSRVRYIVDFKIQFP